MAVIEAGRVIEGSGLDTPYRNAGAPSAGTSEVQTLTIGGTPTAGTFKLGFDGFVTADITFSATDATLVANIDAALEALPNIGAGGVAVADVTLTSGIGDASITFGGNLAKLAVPLITVVTNALNGSGTLNMAETTAGVTATAREAALGAKLIDTTNTKDYINTGTALNPTWTVVGTQT